MGPGPRNALTDVAGLLVGHATDPVVKSGVTVVLPDRPMVAGVHVMGGAPGTRETDLLAPGRLVDHVDALVLSGGSAWGLAAADGVMTALRALGRGYPAGGRRIPIVPAAILFDLAGGGDPDWAETPYPALGRTATEGAGAEIAEGSVGAGTGAIAGRLKGGIGTASLRLDDGTTVGALVAANPVGSVVDPETGRFWAAPFEIDAEFGGLGTPDRAVPDTGALVKGANTTIAIVATDATLDPGQAGRLATVAHDGMARAIVPSHTPFDGDLVFACATAARAAPGPAAEMRIGHAAASCLARAIARAVFAAQPAAGDAAPCWRQVFAGHGPLNPARNSP